MDSEHDSGFTSFDRGEERPSGNDRNDQDVGGQDYQRPLGDLNSMDQENHIGSPPTPLFYDDQFDEMYTTSMDTDLFPPLVRSPDENAAVRRARNTAAARKSRQKRVANTAEFKEVNEDSLLRQARVQKNIEKSDDWQNWSHEVDLGPFEAQDHSTDDFKLFGPDDHVLSDDNLFKEPNFPSFEDCATADSCQEVHLAQNVFYGKPDPPMTIKYLRFAWVLGHTGRARWKCCWSQCQQYLDNFNAPNEHIIQCKYLDPEEYQCLHQLERAWYNTLPIFRDINDHSMISSPQIRRDVSDTFALPLKPHRPNNLTNPSPADSWRTAPSPSYAFSLNASPAYSYRTAPSPNYTPSYAISQNASPAYSYRTAPSPGYTSGALASIAEQTSVTDQSTYMTMVRERGLMLEKNEELNWSDRGQHVEYTKGDRVPLEILGLRGCSNTARVEAVRCKRIKLARKSMMCRNKISLGTALKEVEHLQRLRHPHIIQLVGSYLMNRTFAILLYPVCDLDLKAFMEACQAESPKAVLSTESLRIDRLYLESFFPCLLDAIGYIHANTTRHMDIKPANILMKKRPPNYSQGRLYHVFIADFGLSSHYVSSDHSQTDAMIGRTPKYCAPEVFAYEKWGRAADIFSLGCVFAEMLTVLACRDLLEFADFRANGGDDESYHANIPRVKEWLHQLRGFQDEDINGSPRAWWYYPGAPFVAWEFHHGAAKDCFIPWREMFHDLLDMVNQMLEPSPEMRQVIDGGSDARPGCCGKPEILQYIVED